MIEIGSISEESRMSFKFSNKAIKYDETQFFKSLMKNQGSLKGVDFITYDNTNLILIEVKNYERYENTDLNKIFLKDKSEKDLSYACIRKYKDSIYGILLCLMSNNSNDIDLRDFLKDYFKNKKIIDLNTIELKFILAINYDLNNRKVKHLEKQLNIALKIMKNRIKEFFKDINAEISIHTISEKPKYKEFYEIIN